MTALVPVSVTPPPGAGASVPVAVPVHWPVPAHRTASGGGAVPPGPLVVLLSGVALLGVGLMVASVLLVPLAPQVGAVALSCAVSLAGLWGAWERAKRLHG